MTLGENVKFLREARGLTYEAVGSAVGTDGQNIFNMEKRKSKVSKFAPALAKFFGVDMDDLMQADMESIASMSDPKMPPAPPEAKQVRATYGKAEQNFQIMDEAVKWSLEMAFAANTNPDPKKVARLVRFIYDYLQEKNSFTPTEAEKNRILRLCQVID